MVSEVPDGAVDLGESGDRDDPAEAIAHDAQFDARGRDHRDRAVEAVGLEVGALSEIADRLGYGSPAAFSRAFRRWTGKAPSDARASWSMPG